MRAIFVDKEELQPVHPSKENPGRPDFKLQLARACGSVRPGPVLEYSVMGIPPRKYYTTFCERIKPGGLRILRWETAADRVASR